MQFYLQSKFKKIIIFKFKFCGNLQFKYTSL